MTGFYRTGCCEPGAEDTGAHVICVEVTKEFLAFSITSGNDLSTPVPEIGFPACSRRCPPAGTRRSMPMRPSRSPRATHENALEYVPFEELKKRTLD